MNCKYQPGVDPFKTLIILIRTHKQKSEFLTIYSTNINRDTKYNRKDTEDWKDLPNP